MPSFDRIAPALSGGADTNLACVGAEVEKPYLLDRLPLVDGERISQQLMEIVRNNPGFYDIYTRRERMEPKLRDTRSIYLRRPANFNQLNVRSTIDTAHLLDCENTRMWAVFSPYIDEFVALLTRDYGISRLGRVFITKLLPQADIGPHVDYGYYFKCYHRFHLPLQTQPGCRFIVEEQEQELEQGGLYRLNNCKLHAVENRSFDERVHLIVDAV